MYGISREPCGGMTNSRINQRPAGTGTQSSLRGTFGTQRKGDALKLGKQAGCSSKALFKVHSMSLWQGPCRRCYGLFAVIGKLMTISQVLQAGLP